jgi:predicted RNA binding protein YcfA (HicA-like mRNA interferase family)
MSQSLPAVNARQVLAALRRAGFVVDRIVGSHHVPVHPGDARRMAVSLQAVDFAAAERIKQIAGMRMVA